MRIRDARIDDLPQMLSIYNQAIRHTAATFDLEERDLEERRDWFSHYGGRHPLIIAEEEGRVVGYCSLSPYRSKAAYARTVEVSVYVDTEARGRGVAKRLLAAILERAEQLAHHVVIAGITGGNEASVRLHEAFGFSFIGCFREVGFKFGVWQDVCFYQLILPERGSSAGGSSRSSAG